MHLSSFLKYGRHLFKKRSVQDGDEMLVWPIGTIYVFAGRGDTE